MPARVQHVPGDLFAGILNAKFWTVTVTKTRLPISRQEMEQAFPPTSFEQSELTLRTRSPLSRRAKSP